MDTDERTLPAMPRTSPGPQEPIDAGKRNVLGVLVDAVDYRGAVRRVLKAAEEGRGLSGTALAVHGLMEGVRSPEMRYRLNRLDLVTPDGQPVRWALNFLYGTRLPDRVYGPRLMLEICRAAADRGLPIFLYGSRRDVLDRLGRSLRERVPGLVIAGSEPSLFRTTTRAEKNAIVRRIRDSGARIAFVGLGCPRQEIFAFEYREALRMPVIAVGAAFDYHAGLLREPAPWVQRSGLQWLHRLAQEPRRLWRRYVLLNPEFAVRFALQALGLSRPDPDDARPPRAEVLYG